MPRFRTRPTTIEAEQYTGPASIQASDPRPPAPAGVMWEVKATDSATLFPYVVTCHGQETWVEPGDWIIPEPGGNGHYPCKDSVFRSKYEPAD